MSPRPDCFNVPCGALFHILAQVGPHERLLSSTLALLSSFAFEEVFARFTKQNGHH